MYARNLVKREHGTPPPGYGGTAFGSGASGIHPPGTGEPMAGKRHTPQEYERERRAVLPGSVYSDRDPVPSPAEPPEKPAGTPGIFPLTEFTELLGDLRGRIGTEEAVLLLVMLLLAADGAGVETLLLGILLLAGGN